MNLSNIPNNSRLGRLLRLPLKFLPAHMPIPILTGRLKGKKWIVGSSIHGCWLGTYEYDKQKVFSRIIRLNSVVFDIGGNVGYYSLLASELVGPDGMVFVFEPLPRNLFYLRMHLRLNNVSNVTVIESAVSDTDGLVFFDAGLRGEVAHIAANGKLQVNSLTLDRLLERNEIPMPDYIKIDIEGAELAALTGARVLLRRGRPTIFLATHGQKVHKDCCNFLKQLGYKLESIENMSLENSKEILATFPIS